jgi:hypothetical protein
LMDTRRLRIGAISRKSTCRALRGFRRGKECTGASAERVRAIALPREQLAEAAAKNAASGSATAKWAAMKKAGRY